MSTSKTGAETMNKQWLMITMVNYTDGTGQQEEVVRCAAQSTVEYIFGKIIGRERAKPVSSFVITVVKPTED